MWLDLNNKKVKVPKCDGKIIMKVTRKVPKSGVKIVEETNQQKVKSAEPNIEQFFSATS